MSRDLTSGMQTGVAASTLSIAILAELFFSGGVVRFWTGYGNLVWSGNTYVGTGVFGGVSNVSEANDTRATNTTLSLTGIPSDLLAIVLGEYCVSRQGNVWFALVASPGVLVTDPFLISSGDMDAPTTSDSGVTGSISVNIESELIILGNPNNSRYTDQDQRSRYPLDAGLSFIASQQNVPLTWGVKASQALQKTTG